MDTPQIDDFLLWTAGIVIAAGAQVTRTRIGDRVVSTFAPRWIAGPYCSSYARSSEGATDDGVLAEGWRSHEDGVVPIPPGLSFDETSTLPCAGGSLPLLNQLCVGAPQGQAVAFPLASSTASRHSRSQR